MEGSKLAIKQPQKRVAFRILSNHNKPMAEKPTTPAKKSRGRPAIDPGSETHTVAIRMTGAQREKLAQLGGAPWVREKIDKAKVTTPKE